MRIVSIKYAFCLTEAQVSEKSSTEKSSRTFKGPHTSTQTFTQYTCQYLLRGLLERRSRGGLAFFLLTDSLIGPLLKAQST